MPFFWLSRDSFYEASVEHRRDLSLSERGGGGGCFDSPFLPLNLSMLYRLQCDIDCSWQIQLRGGCGMAVRTQMLPGGCSFLIRIDPIADVTTHCGVLKMRCRK